MPPSKRGVGLGEIKPGLVLHLDPETLEREGGTYACDASRRVQEGHFFLCLSTLKEVGWWLPLFSEPGDGRTKLSRDGRSGHEKWTTGECYWHKDQVWSAPHKAVIAAAIAGADQSSLALRNRLAGRALPKVQ
jgi:hypothetical protein